MTAFLKIDRCRLCQQQWPWEWVPAVPLGGKTLAGTGVWRSTLVEGLCDGCREAMAKDLERERRTNRLREQFIRQLGGVRPYREFTFERYRVTPTNRVAFEHAAAFNQSKVNLYLWGPCGVGKTHLAVAILRRSFARNVSIALVTPFQLIRQVRMKNPDEEQRTLDGFIAVGTFVLDDLGAGAETTFGRQILQEILDGRAFHDRGGLVVTSQFSPATLAKGMGDRAIASRLVGMCTVIGITGPDQRFTRRGSCGAS